MSTIKVRATYEHVNGGPVLIEAVLDGRYRNFTIPRDDIQSVIAGLTQLVAPKVEAIGTPIPSDAEVAASGMTVKRGSFFARLLKGG